MVEVRRALEHFFDEKMSDFDYNKIKHLIICNTKNESQFLLF